VSKESGERERERLKEVVAKNKGEEKGAGPESKGYPLQRGPPARG